MNILPRRTDVTLVAQILLAQLTHLGGILVYMLFILFAIALFQWDTATLLIISLILILGISSLFKLLLHRSRPSPQKYTSMLQKVDAGSFPSVHTMRAVSLVLVFAPLLSSPWSVALASIIAGGVAGSRVLLKKHYISDVIVGMIFAVIVHMLAVYIAGMVTF